MKIKLDCHIATFVFRQSATQELQSSINKFLPQLVDFMDVVNLSTYLVAEDLLTYEERDTILSLKRKHLQVPELLQVLMTKGTNWYERFRAALTRASSANDVHLGHKELLEILPVNLTASSMERSNGHDEEHPQHTGIQLVVSPSYNTDGSMQSLPAYMRNRLTFCHQMWYQRSSCLCCMPSSPPAMASDFSTPIATSSTNSGAAEYIACRESVHHGDDLLHNPLSPTGLCGTQSPCKSIANNWSSTFSKQCSVLLSTAKDVESSLIDISIEKSNLLRENEILKEENEKLKKQVEKLEKSISNDKKHDISEEKMTKGKATNGSCMDSSVTTTEFLIAQQVLHSAEVSYCLLCSCMQAS